MTEHTFGDPLPDEVGDELDDDYDDEPGAMREAFDAPQVLAIVAFVLAVLSLASFGLMSGSSYISPLFKRPDQNGLLVFGQVLSAALALLPVAIGWHAAS